MADQTGKLIIMRKHFLRENGRRARRKFFEPGDIDYAKELAHGFSNAKDEDFIVVQVVYEASRPSKPIPGPSLEGKGDDSSGGGRSLGIQPE